MILRVPRSPSNTFPLSEASSTIFNCVQSRSSLGWTRRSGGTSKHRRDSTRRARGRDDCVTWMYHQRSPLTLQHRYVVIATPDDAGLTMPACLGAMPWDLAVRNGLTRQLGRGKAVP